MIIKAHYVEKYRNICKYWIAITLGYKLELNNNC